VQSLAFGSFARPNPQHGVRGRRRVDWSEPDWRMVAW